MKDKTVFITGANGEIGHLLIPQIANNQVKKLITLDLHPLHEELAQYSDHKIEGSVSDENLIENIFKNYDIDIIIHLAAKLSTSSEKNPAEAFNANVTGTNLLLSKAASVSKKVLFFFPSSISAYGLPDVDTKNNTVVTEEDFIEPITLYGIHKVYGEMLGKYYQKKGLIDFRCIRFPGLMSADTIPSGGTSDFGPEIIHYFAQHKNYTCYAREDSYLPFMAMPDAVDAIVQLINTDIELLKNSIYNINAFSASPKEIVDIAKKHFDEIDINFSIDEMRQSILDSWPARFSDKKARDDWGFNPKYNFEKAFEEYLIPKLH